jgi:NAD(P)-dependent dehydrogenase (short-subunit alcohol dehydrogenase family)
MAAATDLAGKVGLVTGAARGLGRAIAVRLAHGGADVAGLDVTRKEDVLSYALSSPDDLTQTAPVG